MELNTGDDLIALKESLQNRHLPSTESPPSFMEVDEYARFHGLTLDSLYDPLSRAFDRDPFVAATLAPVEPGQLLEHNKPLQECTFHPIQPFREHLEIKAGAFHRLREVAKPLKEHEVADLMSELCCTETFKTRRLKLELPALRSDHVMDCVRLSRRVKAFQKPALTNHRLPLLPTDEVKGEGLKFPASVRNMDNTLMKRLGKETIEIERKTMEVLAWSLRVQWTHKDQGGFAESVLAYEGLGHKEPLTPPLSPRTHDPPEYFVPDGEFCEIPAPPDTDLGLSAEIKAAEQKIFREDNKFWNAFSVREPASPDRYNDLDLSGMIKAGELRLIQSSASPMPVPRDLKVEVPLLPQDTDKEITKLPTRVILPEDLAKARELMSTEPNATDTPFTDFLQEKATSVMRSVEQEKPQPLDATARVPVPIMDFSIPKPDWEYGERIYSASEMFRWIRRTTDTDWTGQKWPRNKTVEHKMVWAPLAHMGEKTLVLEKIDVDPYLIPKFLKVPKGGDLMTAVDCVNKKPGLTILRAENDDSDDDDDENVEAISDTATTTSSPSERPLRSYLLQSSRKTTASLTSQPQIPKPVKARPPPEDLETLLKGRKRVLEEIVQQRQSARNGASGQPKSLSEIGVSDIIDASTIDSTNILRAYTGEYTDYTSLVDNFVELNPPKRPKLTHIPHFNSSGTAPATTLRPQPGNAIVTLMPPPPKPVPAFAPEISPPNTPPKVIVSFTVSGLLTLELEKLLPGIELIVRDYGKHRPPGLVAGHHWPNTDEADIVLSPATGILITTMVRLRQRAIPGKAAGQPLFRNVVENVATRHERLVIFISEGNKHSETMGPLSESDARALAGFQGFAAGLASNIQVMFVGGGIETLAKWVAATICDYTAAESLPVRDFVLPMETSWELFLRRAGMNAYAAQVVLEMFKVPDDQPAIGGSQMYGLPRFVMMTSEERVTMFGGVFGGRRVLDRVSERIDSPWGQRQIGDGL
ncbi:hypothetical protein B0T22DRAFT_479008 [Podospora appendiculata]|uniref:Uncharacterized protein n=1 Tax=Podospora appendiculata TaxID=314037 RepID=A0AAE0X8C3_9PEZI|nr:hypothetical protein B0T22DRAFT_479008 [Podospora appendiculata]